MAASDKVFLIAPVPPAPHAPQPPPPPPPGFEWVTAGDATATATAATTAADLWAALIGDAFGDSVSDAVASAAYYTDAIAPFLARQPAAWLLLRHAASGEVAGGALAWCDDEAAPAAAAAAAAAAAVADDAAAASSLGRLHWVCVRPAFRRQGVGAAWWQVQWHTTLRVVATMCTLPASASVPAHCACTHAPAFASSLPTVAAAAQPPPPPPPTSAHPHHIE